jgi:hypothetical protein
MSTPRRRSSFLPAAVLATIVTTAAAQDSATVKVPDIVKAGETLSLEIRVNQAPNFDGAGLMVWITGPDKFIVQSGCSLKQGEKSCLYSYLIPVDATAGDWSVSRIALSTGAHQSDLSFTKVPFKVIGKTGLVFPTSAEVAINPSQIQLFRREALRLQQHLQTLKEQLTDLQRSSSPNGASILVRSIKTEMGALVETEARFKELNHNQSQEADSRVFFSDLRKTYEDVLSHLPVLTSATSEQPTLLLSKFTEPVPSGNALGLQSLAVFRALEQNESAYSLVAETETLTFNLEVNSVPAGASVSYHRRGDAYQDLPTQTNSTIKSLPLAIWLVRFQKAGYSDREIEHDPFTEPNHSLTVELHKK